MSVIQQIRDKYARIAVIAIALALLGFILMDALAGRGSVLGGNDTTLGKINGKKIEYDQFNRRVSDYTKRQGQNGENATQQVVNGLWQQEINWINYFSALILRRWYCRHLEILKPGILTPFASNSMKLKNQERLKTRPS